MKIGSKLTEVMYGFGKHQANLALPICSITSVEVRLNTFKVFIDDGSIISLDIYGGFLAGFNQYI